MVEELNLLLIIKSVETVWESDDLAFSTRNQYFNGKKRIEASQLSRALNQAKFVLLKNRNVYDIKKSATNTFLTNPNLSDIVMDLDYLNYLKYKLFIRYLNYLEIVNPETFLPILTSKTLNNNLLVIIAAQISQTRIIDNNLIKILNCVSIN